MSGLNLPEYIHNNLVLHVIILIIICTESSVVNDSAVEAMAQLTESDVCVCSLNMVKTVETAKPLQHL